MKFTLGVLGLLLAASFGSSMPALAQGVIEQRWADFRALDKDQKKKIREDYVLFLRLPPSAQTETRDWVRGWASLPEPQRDATAAGLRRWNRLTLEERETLRAAWARWNALTEAQKNEWRSR